MKDEKKNKRKVLPEDEKKKKVKKKIDPKHQEEQEELFKQSDAISPANKKVDKKEIVELNNGEKIDLEEYILENYAEKSTHFYRSFYYVIADLMGISRTIMHQFVKPLIVPMLKKALIYGRFPNAVQQRLYTKNYYIGYYTRVCWNYQWLTKDADLKLREFINEFEREAESVFIAGGDMRTFITEYCGKRNMPIQLELFGLE